MGVSGPEYGHIVECPTQSCGAITGGNPGLSPEKSLTKTLGFTWAPMGLLAGFAASVDVFDITIKNTIGTIGANVTLTQCTQTLNPFFCNLIHRDANGSLFADGAGIVDTNLNTGTLRTRGLDTQVRYRTAIGSLGHLAFNLVGTYVKESSTEPLPGLGSYDCAGLYGYTCGTPRPNWRHTLRTIWELPYAGAEVALNWRYFGSVGFDGNTSQPLLTAKTTIAPIKAQSFFDLSGSVKLTDKVSLVAGVGNVLDKDPPIVSYTYLNAAANTYPQVYDAMGRTIFVSVSAEL
jgi:outer membrane receptor protein involved in Fe transport